MTIGRNSSHLVERVAEVREHGVGRRVTSRDQGGRVHREQITGERACEQQVADLDQVAGVRGRAGPHVTHRLAREAPGGECEVGRRCREVLQLLAAVAIHPYPGRLEPQHEAVPCRKGDLRPDDQAGVLGGSLWQLHHETNRLPRSRLIAPFHRSKVEQLRDPLRPLLRNIR